MGRAEGRIRRRDDEAVSAVVGVVLMIAITIVLSATIFFVIKRINTETADEAPKFGVTKDANAREVRVATAAIGLDWFEDIRIAGTCSPTLNGGPFPTAPGTTVQAGDILGCEAGEDLRIVSSPDHGNALLYQTLFS